MWHVLKRPIGFCGGRVPKYPTGQDVRKHVEKAKAEARLTPKAYDREDGIVRTHLAPFNSLKLVSIRKLDIQRYVTDASAERAPGSVRKELVTLKQLFNLAVEWEIIPVNPAQGVKAPKLPPGRLRYLQPTELRALLEACPDGLRQIVALAVSTRMRRGEVMGLRYLDVDLANCRIRLPQTKNGDGRIVYLNGMAAQVFRSVGWDAETTPTDKIFSSWTPQAVTMAFGRLCRSLGILDFRFHDLRHTAASWMMSGRRVVLAGSHAPPLCAYCLVRLFSNIESWQ